MSRIASSAVLNGREPFLAFASDDAALDVLQSVVTHLGWRADSCKKGGLRAAVQALSVAASPAMLLVDLSGSSDALSDVESLAEVCEPGTIVFATGVVNDVTLYRELISRGIHDYFVKPLSPNQVQDALERTHRALTTSREKPEEGESNHISVAVVGTRGGVGTSMLATSVAWLLSSEHRRSTALLDLDVHFGTGALSLDLEPGRGLTDAIENPARIDGLFIDRALVRVNEKLAIMSAEAPLSADLLTDGSAFVRLEQEFRQNFEALVIDLPRSIMLNFPQVLAGLDTVILASELTLASARDAIRILAWLKSNAPGARTLVVANKVPAAAGEISQADFSAAIEQPIAFAVPFDLKAAAQAARAGQSLLQANRSSKTVAPLVDLARKIAGQTADDSKSAASSLAGKSLLAKLDLRAFLPKKDKPSAHAPA